MTVTGNHAVEKSEEERYAFYKTQPFFRLKIEYATLFGVGAAGLLLCVFRMTAGPVQAV